jgi:hypothetical protein
MSLADFTALMDLYSLRLVNQIFVAMTDAVHKDELDYYVKLLMKIWSSIDQQRFGDAWINFIIHPRVGFAV